MPALPDKVILDKLDFDADSYSLLCAFKGAKQLGDEIVEAGGGLLNNNLLKEDASLHLVEQESICADIRKAMADSIKRQRALNDKRRKWLDTKL
jgi:hypothetical protein